MKPPPSQHHSFPRAQVVWRAPASLRALWSSAFLVALLGSSPLLWAGTTIEGVVKLSARPAPAAAAVARYQARGADATAANTAPWPAVVYLEGTFPLGAVTNGASTNQLGQKNLQFIPRVLPVRRGTRVEFPNMDDEYHNVLSYSKAKEFDLGRYRNNENPPAVVFDKPGVVELDCEIHAHMRATILVLDTPFFTTTDAAGKFTLAGLPPGKYTLKVWLDAKTTWSQPVELKDGEPAQVNFPGP